MYYLCGQNYKNMRYTHEINTKNGWRTNIDRWDIMVNGRHHQYIWGKTKSVLYARNMTNNLFQQNNNKIEIVNQNTGECIRIQ